LRTADFDVITPIKSFHNLTNVSTPKPASMSFAAAVGGLRHARDEIAVGNHYWRVCRVGIGEEDGGCILRAAVSFTDSLPPESLVITANP
jgi:hypothetical protein